MSEPDDLTWAPLGDADFDDLVALAAACLGADGGLPIAAEPSFVAAPVGRRRHGDPVRHATPVAVW